MALAAFGDLAHSGGEGGLGVFFLLRLNAFQAYVSSGSKTQFCQEFSLNETKANRNEAKGKTLGM